jgi:hypothetical protein
MSKAKPPHSIRVDQEQHTGRILVERLPSNPVRSIKCFTSRVIKIKCNSVAVSVLQIYHDRIRKFGSGFEWVLAAKRQLFANSLMEPGAMTLLNFYIEPRSTGSAAKLIHGGANQSSFAGSRPTHEANVNNSPLLNAVGQQMITALMWADPLQSRTSAKRSGR